MGRTDLLLRSVVKPTLKVSKGLTSSFQPSTIPKERAPGLNLGRYPHLLGPVPGPALGFVPRASQGQGPCVPVTVPLEVVMLPAGSTLAAVASTARRGVLGWKATATWRLVDGQIELQHVLAIAKS
jgi:hypothetical protein